MFDVEAQKDIGKLIEAGWDAQKMINTLKEQVEPAIKLYIASTKGLLVISNGHLERIDFTPNGVHFRYVFSILPQCDEVITHTLPKEYFVDPLAYMNSEYMADMAALEQQREKAKQVRQ